MYNSVRRFNYFAALAAISDARTPEWQETAAGLVTLRLVDDWLKHGPSLIHIDSPALIIARDVVAQVPQTNILRPLLTRVIDEIERTEEATVRAIAQPLLAYSERLQDNGALTLSVDVLSALREEAEREGDFQNIFETSRRLGASYRIAGQLGLSEENYHKALYYARKLGDVRKEYPVTTGLAKTHAVQGNVSLADTWCAELVKKTKAIGAMREHQSVLQDHAFILSLMGDHESALPLYYLILENQHEDHDMVMADLSGTLGNLGRIEECYHMDLILAVSAKQQSTRWQASTNLMDTAVRLGRPAEFELYRSGMALTPLPSWAAISYHKYAAAGYQAFGKPIEAATELEKARAIARVHGISTSLGGRELE